MLAAVDARESTDQSAVAPNAPSTASRYGLWPSVVTCTRPAQAARYVLHKVSRGARITRSDEPGRDQLRVCVDGRPRPDRADSELAALIGRHVLVLRADERPARGPVAGLTGLVALPELSAKFHPLLASPEGLVIRVSPGFDGFSDLCAA